VTIEAEIPDGEINERLATVTFALREINEYRGGFTPDVPAPDICF